MGLKVCQQDVPTLIGCPDNSEKVAFFDVPGQPTGMALRAWETLLSCLSQQLCSGIITITNPDFQPDGITYINTNLANKSLKVFGNWIPKFLNNPTEWVDYPGGGIQITIPEFNAATQGYSYELEIFVGCFVPVTTGSGGNQKEIIQFDGIDTMIIPMNSTRKAQFGNALDIRIEILDDSDNIIRKTAIEEITDDLFNTTFYTLNFGGISKGRVILS